MNDKLHTRLKELQTEYQKGQERLTALEQETNTVRTSMLRISGAIQVLEELLNKETLPEEKNIIDKVQLHTNGVDK